MFIVGVSIKGTEHDFVVDTGARWVCAPASFLKALSVPVMGRIGALLADGRRDQMEWGEAQVSIAGLECPHTCQVMFMPEGSPFLLGSLAREQLGVIVDPINHRLMEADSVLVCAHGRIVVGRQI